MSDVAKVLFERTGEIYTWGQRGLRNRKIAADELFEENQGRAASLYLETGNNTYDLLIRASRETNIGVWMESTGRRIILPSRTIMDGIISYKRALKYFANKERKPNTIGEVEQRIEFLERYLPKHQQTTN